jgi:nucleotide-binding universal stress UspA family protein
MEDVMKILIGYDGSSDSDGALRDLALAGLPSKAQVLILTVTTIWQLPKPGKWSGRLEREAARLSEESFRDAVNLAGKAASQVKQLFPGWKVASEAVADSPAHALLLKAESWKPDLIVLGCHGRSAIGKLLMGSVSQKVLHHGSSDVCITRCRERSRSAPPRVIVAVDGSIGSDYAVSAVAARTWPKGTRVRVLSALHDDGFFQALEVLETAMGAVKGGKGKSKWLELKGKSAAQRLSALGLKTESVLCIGDPRISIPKAAKEWSADCIFLGSRGMSGIDRFLLGSVSSSVAAHADCTVEIVRRKRPMRRTR